MCNRIRIRNLEELLAVNENPDSYDAKAEDTIDSSKDLPSKSVQPTLNLNSFVRAFSAIRNTKKIFSIKENDESLSCLHGIRFLSMTWVILGHTFYFAIPYLDNPTWALEKIQDTISMEAVVQGTFSVDSFFFLRKEFN